MGGKQPIKTVNDGGVTLQTQSLKTGSVMHTKIPVLSLEVSETPECGGKKVGTGQAEPWVAKVRAQQFGELLGQTMTFIRSLSPEADATRTIWDASEWQDQESWLLPIQGVNVRVVTTKFTAEYLAAANGQ
ncbi:hypothetical protein SI65_03410 [Aspergillus cristatus]|uniref:Uncharacterized protein n=1 Tax=Aspergillus cristatus TaxID=573508 RepID=A0A1E3BHG4_ASPCR|nr:hypothetical protein SI65_03410 [Aspergillus cristatus]